MTVLIPTVELSSVPVAHRLPTGVSFGPRHLHDFEFVWLLSGRADVQLDHARHTLHPGQLQLSRPGMVDHYVWLGNHPSHAYVHFRLIDRGRLPKLDEWPTVVDIPRQGALPGLLADMAGFHTTEDTSEAEEVTALLLDRFVMARPGGHPRTPTSPFIAELTAVLSHRWRTGTPTDPIDVSQLAAQLSLSRSHLARLTRRHFGASPHELVELLRLSRAAVLLRRTNTPVQVIAVSCGFGDQFHFAKRFRRHYGTTATRYRTGDGPSPRAILAERSATLHELGRLVETW